MSENFRALRVICRKFQHSGTSSALAARCSCASGQHSPLTLARNKGAALGAGLAGQPCDRVDPSLCQGPALSLERQTGIVRMGEASAPAPSCKRQSLRSGSSAQRSDPRATSSIDYCFFQMLVRLRDFAVRVPNLDASLHLHRFDSYMESGRVPLLA